jgi:hypothetical protein
MAVIMAYFVEETERNTQKQHCQDSLYYDPVSKQVP